MAAEILPDPLGTFPSGLDNMFPAVDTGRMVEVELLVSIDNSAICLRTSASSFWVGSLCFCRAGESCNRFGLAERKTWETGFKYIVASEPTFRHISSKVVASSLSLSAVIGGLVPITIRRAVDGSCV